MSNMLCGLIPICVSVNRNWTTACRGRCRGGRWLRHPRHKVVPRTHPIVCPASNVRRARIPHLVSRRVGVWTAGNWRGAANISQRHRMVIVQRHHGKYLPCKVRSKYRNSCGLHDNIARNKRDNSRRVLHRGSIWLMSLTDKCPQSRRIATIRK